MAGMGLYDQRFAGAEAGHAEGSAARLCAVHSGDRPRITGQREMDSESAGQRKIVQSETADRRQEPGLYEERGQNSAFMRKALKARSSVWNKEAE